MKFKVGDIIKGIDRAHYPYTNTGMTKGRVTKVYEDVPSGERDIRIEVLEHTSKYVAGAKFDVKSKYFELVEHAPFGKSDLKTGMQVRTNAGGLYMVLENIDTKVYGKQQFILANFEGGFLCGSDYDDELKHVDHSKYDIAKVYDVPATRSILEPLRYAAPIWKREEEPIEITIKEIADWKGVSPERIRIKED